MIELVSSPAEKALVQMLWCWAWFARHEHKLDMFFSRPNAHGSGTEGRKRLRQSDVNQVAKFCAVAEDLLPSCFSTNSFKVGGYSRQLREEGSDASTKPDAVQRRLIGYFGHRSISAAKHYQRPSARSHGPLSKVWLDASKDQKDQRDLADNMKLGAGVKPAGDTEKADLLIQNRKRIKSRDKFLRSFRKRSQDVTEVKRARLATSRLVGVDA